MADKKPIKATYSGTDTNGLAEFIAADTIGVADGGTGLTTVAPSNLLTGNGADPLSAEANLTFDGSTLAVTGAGTISTSLTVGGGYGSTGATISTAGVGQFNGALTTDGALTVGGDVHVSTVNSLVNIGNMASKTVSEPTIQMATTGERGGFLTNTSSSEFYMSSNAYYNSGWKYSDTNAAAYVGLEGPIFTFRTAASGSANAAITFSERMRIYESGSTSMGGPLADGYGLNVVWGGANSAIRASATAAGVTPLSVYNGHTSTTCNFIQLGAERAATTAYNFFFAYTGGADTNEAFKLTGTGNGLAEGSWQDGSFDYAEYFESTDGEALELGKSVVLENGKVRVYTDADSTDDIMGVVRPKGDAKGPAAHNTAWNGWHDKYLTDDWGVYIREDVTVWEWDKIDAVEASEGVDAVEGREEGSCYERDEAEDWTPPAGATSSTQSIRKLNPEYSVELNYTPREDRDEWNLIGLLGQAQIKADEPTRPTWIKMKDISDAVELWMIR